MDGPLTETIADVSEEFSPEARRVLESARREAQAFGHEYVGTEHLLLALLAGRGVVARALRTLGVSRQHVQAEVERVIGRGDAAPQDELPFTPAAESALARSREEAHGRTHVEPPDLLIAVSDEEDGLASRILLGVDVSPERLRSAVAQQG